MMTTGRIRKPVLSAIAVLCLVSSLPAARIAADLFAPGEDLLGYGALGVALTMLVAMLSAGFMAGLFGILRNEQPRYLAIMACLLNGLSLAWLLVEMPG